MAKELKGFLAEHARQVDESGDIDNPSEAQQQLAKKHRFEWEDSPLCWGDEALSGDEPSVASADEMLVLYHTYFGGFDELSPYLKARGATIEDQERDPPTVLFRFKLPGGDTVVVVSGTYGNGKIRRRIGDGAWEVVKQHRGGLRAAYCITDKRFIVTGTHGTIYLSTDGGTKWTKKKSNTDHCLFCPSATPDGTVLIAGDSGLILRSRDKCKSFEHLETKTNKMLYNVGAASDKPLFCVGHGGLILRSKNGGDTWQKLKSGVTVPLCLVLPLDEQRIVIVGDAGVLLTSSDGGKSWVRRRGAGKAEVEDVALGNDGRLCAITGGGQILISKNDGKTWTSEPSGARTHLWTIWPSPSGTLYIVGDNGTFVRKEGLDSAASEKDAAGPPAMKGAGAVELPATGKSFLFTGKLSSMTRAQAKAKTEKLGGVTKSSVTKNLDYLVVGDEGSPLWGQGKKGSKIVAAEKLIESGASLKIISERTFLAMKPGK